MCNGSNMPPESVATRADFLVQQPVKQECEAEGQKDRENCEWRAAVDYHQQRLPVAGPTRRSSEKTTPPDFRPGVSV